MIKKQDYDKHDIHKLFRRATCCPNIAVRLKIAVVGMHGSTSSAWLGLVECVPVAWRSYLSDLILDLGGAALEPWRGRGRLQRNLLWLKRENLKPLMTLWRGAFSSEGYEVQFCCDVGHMQIDIALVDQRFVCVPA